MAWLSRALRAFLHAANWGSNPAMVSDFVFSSHIFFFNIFPKVALQLYKGVTIVRL